MKVVDQLSLCVMSPWKYAEFNLSLMWSGVLLAWLILTIHLMKMFMIYMEFQIEPHYFPAV
jgi:hypothetical protein